MPELVKAKEFPYGNPRPPYLTQCQNFNLLFIKTSKSQYKLLSCFCCYCCLFFRCDNKSEDTAQLRTLHCMWPFRDADTELLSVGSFLGI